MKLLLTLGLLAASLLSQELKIKADSFHADEKKGLSFFEGRVHIVRAQDELQASKVIVHTNKQNEPIKYVAEGKASFTIVTLDGSIYKGRAEKVVYQPSLKEYYFYKNVHLEQINEKKEIIGNEVVLKTIEGKAYAKGANKEPVIMIFNMPKDEK